jgi:DNA-binding NarL/FixJ family response regulator
VTPLTIVLADDHALVRAGMHALLSELEGVEVVAEAGDGQEALQLIREKKPDIALVDIAMPGLNGLEVAMRLSKEKRRTRVIIVTMHRDDESVRRALLSGAAGFLLKHADRAELEMAVRAVARGDTWLSPGVTSKVVAAFTGGGGQSTMDAPYEALTSRQREVLQLVAEGLSSKEIAARLGLSVKTVDTHRTELMERLDVHGVAGLVRYAVRVGLVRPDT